MELPSLTRGEARPVRRRTRTFRPNYLSFAGTYQCNLSCPHCCVPIEWTDRLDIGVALRFLEQARAAGIAILGFTGGEPFLYPEFLVAITRRAAELGFRFDKLMSNGVWFADEEHLSDIFKQLRDAGFTGKLGLSVDKFHGMDIAKLALYCRTARRVFDRDTIVSLSYASRSPDAGLEPIRRLAEELGGVLAWSELLHRYMLVSDDLTMTLNWNHLAAVERAETLPGNPWDGTWFAEDYCEGPGQALIVNPKGEVKPCCGFASDLDQLTIGNIHTDSVATIVRRARKHPYVGKVFREGLLAIRDEVLQNNENAFPAATSNHCFFCWYVLTKNLTALPKVESNGRVGLPMASAAGTEFVMAFDGKTVFLQQEPSAEMPLEEGRVYLIKIAGVAPVEQPWARLTWKQYQAWIDRLRDAGLALTTHPFSPCQK